MPLALRFVPLQYINAPATDSTIQWLSLQVCGVLHNSSFLLSVRLLSFSTKDLVLFCGGIVHQMNMTSIADLPGFGMFIMIPAVVHFDMFAVPSCEVTSI